MMPRYTPVAKTLHWLMMSSAKGFQTVWFGVLPIPDLVDKDKELGDLKHHFIDRDDMGTHRHRCRGDQGIRIA